VDKLAVSLEVGDQLVGREGVHLDDALREAALP